jgi:hypothetical protein
MSWMQRYGAKKEICIQKELINLNKCRFLSDSFIQKSKNLNNSRLKKETLPYIFSFLDSKFGFDRKAADYTVLSLE